MDERNTSNFLQAIVTEDLASGRVTEVKTRFPPEPNGYLHLGHAKSISVNFDLAERYGGRCNLRFDDTNPGKESQEYIDAIQADIRWLGYVWDGNVKYASSYFQQLYEWAVYLVNQGHAYVCDLSPEEARDYRGTLTLSGRNSPYRQRSVAENLDLLQRMQAGEFDEGAKVLRAKIDMSSPNMNLRDPILYRIRKVPHHQTGHDWVIYPTYDFAHGQEDAIEGITHSICTLEFEDHRPLYDWLLEHLPVPSKPRQYEFGRLNPSYTVTSKRKLRRLVDDGVVSGWDDPRMPTVCGMRRRGYTPTAIRRFCDMIGTTRSDGVVDIAMLEFAIREDLNENAVRGMCVLDPLKIVLTDYPEQQVEELRAPRHPSRGDLGERLLPFTRELFIDAADFREEANKKYKRLVLGKRVRLRNAYVIEADELVRDDSGNMTEVRAHIVPDTLGKDPADGIKAKGVIHWVSATHGRRAEVRLYDRLFSHEAPDRGQGDFLEHLNPDSLQVIAEAWIEPSLAEVVSEQHVQFEREGYFVADRHDSRADKPVFNRTIGLRDTWSKG
ncbi:MAG: glutamine--tRNA ligase/YqeY domain fusion protein [Halioglobus sp.]|nr:glutamine--tRNA ligase/YqeY domain fusion protein [Halioglobus sp.]